VPADPAPDVQDIKRRIQPGEILEHIHILGASIGVGKTDSLRNDFLVVSSP
jgi:hypothetical protein